MIFLVPYACILSAFWVQYYTVTVAIARRKVRMVQISHELLPPIPSLSWARRYISRVPYAMQVNTAARLLRVGYQEYLHPLISDPLSSETPRKWSVCSCVCSMHLQNATGYD